MEPCTKLEVENFLGNILLILEGGVRSMEREARASDQEREREREKRRRRGDRAVDCTHAKSVALLRLSATIQ